MSKRKSHAISLFILAISSLAGISSHTVELLPNTQVKSSPELEAGKTSDPAESLPNTQVKSSSEVEAGKTSDPAESLPNTQVKSSPEVETGKSSNPIGDDIGKNSSPYQTPNNKSQHYPILNPNLLNIKGPDVTLIFKNTQAKEIFEYLAEIGNYGFVWVKMNPTSKIKEESERLITLTLNNVNYKRAFNALLLSSGLQAKLYDNVLYIGPNVKDTVFTSRSTGVYQLNQISASSAADYLANLGASVTKTYTIKTSVTQGASSSESVEGASTSSTTTDQSETSVKVYGATIGPLVGLIATTDERLQTVTMVGEKSLIDLASVFLQRLDKRQKQVALIVKVLDVNITDKDSFSQSWGGVFESGSPFIIGKGGIIKSSIGRYTPNYGSYESSNNNPGRSFPNTSKSNDFFGLLEASIEKGSTKVLASPTLLLSETSGEAGDGNKIGMKVGNEGYVKVGDQVATNATNNDGVCNYTFDNVGIELGAKVLGIDQNDYITFTMTPIVTAISSTLTIPTCGEVSVLNERRLDTGAVRIKDGETLVLTGVLQDTDIEKLYKYPILGDIPLLGGLFRSTNNEFNKRELIVLVTPRLLNDSGTNIERYSLSGFEDKDVLDLIEQVK